MSNKVDRFAEELTAVIIEKIKSLSKDYETPWFTKTSIPTNLSGRPYSGMNQVLLTLFSEKNKWDLPVFMTFNAAKNKGVSILKGSKSLPIQYYNNDVVHNETKERITYADYLQLSKEEQKEYSINLIRSMASVFNVAQTNLQEKNPELYKVLQSRYQAQSRNIENSRENNIDKLVKDNSWLCPILTDQTEKAFYSITNNNIHIPPKGFFKSDEKYYSTLLHEMTHSTGHSSLLDRIKPSTFGSEIYAREELVAELGASISGIHYGITKTVSDNNTAYLKGWLSVIEKTPEYLYSVVADASKASNMIIDHVDKVTLSQTKDISDMETKKQIPEEIIPPLSMYITTSKMTSSEPGYESLPVEVKTSILARERVLDALTLNSDSEKEGELLQQKHELEDTIRENIRVYILTEYGISIPPTLSRTAKLQCLPAAIQQSLSPDLALYQAEQDTILVSSSCDDTPENREHLEQVDADYQKQEDGTLSYSTQLRLLEGYVTDDTPENRKVFEDNDIEYKAVRGNRLFTTLTAQKLALLATLSVIVNPVAVVLLAYVQHKRKVMDNILKDKQFNKDEARRLNNGETVVKTVKDNGKTKEKIYFIDKETNKLASLYAYEYHIPHRVNGIELNPNQIQSLKNGSTITGYDDKLKQHYEMKLDANSKDGVKTGFKELKADKEFTYVPTPNSPDADKIKYVQLHGASGVNDIWDRGGVNLERDSFLDQYDIEGFYKDHLQAEIDQNPERALETSEHMKEALGLDEQQSISRGR